MRSGKFIRSLIIMFLSINAASAVFNSISQSISSTSARERRITILPQPHIPVKVRAIGDLQNDHWLHNMEIETENNSHRRIYFLEILLVFPDVPSMDTGDGINRRYQVRLKYGRSSLMQAGQFLTAEDVPINPGQKHIFKIPESLRKGLISFISRNNLSPLVTNRVEVRIFSVIFEDGSGFKGGAPFAPENTLSVSSFPGRNIKQDKNVRC